MNTNNPYYVQPARLSGMITGMGDAFVQRRQADQAKATDLAVRKEGARLLTEGTPDEIREFSALYPDMAEMIQTSFKTKNEETRANYVSMLKRVRADPTQLPALVKSRMEFGRLQGLTDEELKDTASFEEKYKQDPEGTLKSIDRIIAFNSDKEEWEQYKDAIGLDMGAAKAGKTPTTAMAKYIQDNPTATTEELIKFSGDLATANKGASGANEWAPSSLKKLITERDSLLTGGADENSPEVKAYNNKISGVDIDIEDMTEDELEFWGNNFNLTGRMPTMGRGKQSTKARMKIAKRAARIALGAEEAGVPEGEPTQTPAEAALAVIGSQSDTKAIQGSLNFLDKQLSSMGSFVTNLNSQVDRVGELAQELETFDTRLLNVPLRTLRGKIAGSPLQSKYDMFLSEIESEIGKLATGSTGSVAELSASAQEKWSSIHDKNLSTEDMLSLLEETRNAANFRVNSVRDQLDKTRGRMRDRPTGAPEAQQTQGNIIEVTNPATGLKEKWDLTTEQRVN